MASAIKPSEVHKRVWYKRYLAMYRQMRDWDMTKHQCCNVLRMIHLGMDKNHEYRYETVAYSAENSLEFLIGEILAGDVR